MIGEPGPGQDCREEVFADSNTFVEAGLDSHTLTPAVSGVLISVDLDYTRAQPRVSSGLFSDFDTRGEIL